MPSRPTWPVAAATLVVGFLVAQGTGVRALGGVVLLLGAGWCAVRWQARGGTRSTLTLLGVFLAAFVGSHLAGLVVGTWPAVLGAAAVTGLAAWRLSDRRVAAGAPGALRATMGT